MIGTSAAQPRCVALVGRVGEDARCSIHGRHPSPCKAVEPGSSQCRRARDLHGLAPLADGLADGLPADLANTMALPVSTPISESDAMADGPGRSVAPTGQATPALS